MKRKWKSGSATKADPARATPRIRRAWGLPRSEVEPQKPPLTYFDAAYFDAAYFVAAGLAAGVFASADLLSSRDRRDFSREAAFL